jgi:hypothetical protein
VTARAAEILLQGDHQPHFRVAESPVKYTIQAPANLNTDSKLDQVISTEPPGTSHELALALASLNIVSMTPIEAINVLFSLQQRALQALHEPATEGNNWRTRT